MTRMTLILAAVLAVVSQTADGEIVLENSRLRAVLGDDAVWRSLTDQATGQEYLASAQALPLATVRLGETTRVANRVRQDGTRWLVEFAGCDTRLTYAVTVAENWFGLRLAEIAGARPSHVTLVQLPVTITAAARG